MKQKVQARVLELIEQNPGATVSLVRELMSGIQKGTLCSTLSRLYFLRMVKRDKNQQGHFQYWIEDGLPVMAEDDEDSSEPQPLHNLKMVSPAEWDKRYELACRLEEKGFYRRADRVLLELLDVTPATKAREEIIHKRAGYSRLENLL